MQFESNLFIFKKFFSRFYTYTRLHIQYTKVYKRIYVHRAGCMHTCVFLHKYLHISMPVCEYVKVSVCVCECMLYVYI